jgi:WD40 repeat protein
MAASFDRVGQLLVTTSAGTSAKLWSVATGKLQNEVDHGAPITSACFDDHRRRLLTSGRDGVICAWDLQSGRRLATIAVPGERERQLHMVLDHAGARLLVTSSSGRALLLDAESGEVLHHLSGLSPMHRTGVVARSAFAPDDRVVVTVPADDAQSTLLLTETATGATMATLRGHRGMILSVAFAADGRLVSGAVDGTARIWHLGDPAPLVLTHHDDAVQQARFDPSGARVLTCGSDCTARIFDAATGRELAVLRGHDGMLYCGEFSPDGSKVITASWDGTAAIWDAATGVRLVHQEAHTRPVFSAMFSPDGATAATTSLDGTARLWPVDPLAFARTGAR